MAKKARVKELDWIDRDDDFVHRGGARSGWDESGKSVTDYLVGDSTPVSPEAQVKEVYQLCRNRASNLAGDKKVGVLFSPDEDTGHTDGKKVYVSTKVLDEKKTFKEKADILLGITTHEMAHVRETNWDALKKGVKNSFTHGIWNIIEDERIEHLTGEEFPGYANNLAAVKEYFFNEKYLLEKAIEKGMMPPAPPPGADPEDEDEEEPGGIPKHLVAEEEDEDPTSVLTSPMKKEEQAAAEIYDLFFKFVRYPGHIDEELVGKHEATLDELKGILTPYPMDAVSAIKAANRVAEVIDKKMAEEISDPSALEALKESISRMMEFLEADSTPGKSAPREMSDAVEKYDYREEWIEDKDYKAVFRKSESEPRVYQALLNPIKGDARKLANVLFTKTYNETKVLHGMRSGALDDMKIVEAAHGVPTVHLSKIPKKSKKLNIVLLIDESGSMASGTKIRDAQSVAILLETAYNIFAVGQLFIYGFTSDDGDDFNTLIRYREPGLDVKYGLGSVHARSNNRDGHCIRAAARRVRVFTQENCLYFIISDGQPAGERYNGTGAIKDTHNACKEVTKMGFFPMQIGIGGGITEDQQKQMFDDYVNYVSSRQMVEDIRKVLLRKAHRFMGI